LCRADIGIYLFGIKALKGFTTLYGGNTSMKETKYNVIVKESGFVIADDCTLAEAMVIIREVEIIDIKDGTFEPDFYEIVEAATN